MRILESLIQGSEQWYDYRLKRLTATDSGIILGHNKWRTPYDLWLEKVTGESKIVDNDAMSRGRALEPLARECFSLTTGIDVRPAIIESDEIPWAAASLDGLSYDDSIIVEIKCPLPENYDLSLNGQIPKHYVAQLQKQLFCSGHEWLYYFCFSGTSGHAIKVYRDEEFIKKMIAAEKEFWDRVCNFDPPETCDKDFTEVTDDNFLMKAHKFLDIKSQIEWLENEEAALKTELLTYAEQGNVKGGGLKIQKVVRKGSIDYKQIDVLQGLDLEQYRRSPSEYYLIKEAS